MIFKLNFMDRAALAISLISLISGFSLIASRNLFRMLPLLQCTIANQLLASALYGLYVWTTLKPSVGEVTRRASASSRLEEGSPTAQNGSKSYPELEQKTAVGEALWVELGRVLVLSHLGCKWALFLWKFCTRMSDLCVLMVLALHILRLRAAVRAASVSRWRLSVSAQQSTNELSGSKRGNSRAASASSSQRQQRPLQLTLERFSVGRCRFIALTLIAFMILVAASWYYVWAFVPVPFVRPIRVGSDAFTLENTCGPPPNNFRFTITHRLVEPIVQVVYILVIMSLLAFSWAYYLKNRALLRGSMLVEPSSSTPLGGKDQNAPRATRATDQTISDQTQTRSKKTASRRSARAKRGWHTGSITTLSNSIDAESGKATTNGADAAAGGPESSPWETQQVSVVIENDSPSPSIAGIEAACNRPAAPANAQSLSKCSSVSHVQLDPLNTGGRHRESSSRPHTQSLLSSRCRRHRSSSNPMPDAANAANDADAGARARHTPRWWRTRVRYTVLVMNVTLTLLALCPLLALPDAVFRLTLFRWPTNTWSTSSSTSASTYEPLLESVGAAAEREMELESPLLLWPGRLLAPPSLITSPSARATSAVPPASTLQSLISTPSANVRAAGVTQADSAVGISGGHSALIARELISALAALRFPLVLLMLAIDELVLILLSPLHCRQSSEAH